MNHRLLKFIVAVTFVSLAFIFIPILAKAQHWIGEVPTYSIEITSILAILTVIIFFFLANIQKESPQKFVQSYMLSITLKMLIGCALILILIFVDREGAIPNAMLFILSYFLFTGVEIFFLWKGNSIA